jgi:hypothetical protein
MRWARWASRSTTYASLSSMGGNRGGQLVDACWIEFAAWVQRVQPDRIALHATLGSDTICSPHRIYVGPTFSHEAFRSPAST